MRSIFGLSLIANVFGEEFKERIQRRITVDDKQNNLFGNMMKALNWQGNVITCITCGILR